MNPHSSSFLLKRSTRDGRRSSRTAQAHAKDLETDEMGHSLYLLRLLWNAGGTAIPIIAAPAPGVLGDRRTAAVRTWYYGSRAGI